MIVLNQEQRLGRKAYLLLASRQMVPGIIILLIAFALLAASSTIAGVAIGFAKIGGLASTASSASISGGVSYVVMLIFMLGLVALVMSLVAARIEYRNYTFTFEEFGLKLKRGLFRLTEVSIPYRQMQDVDVERGFTHQLTGTSRVVINSAGHEEAAEHNETDIVLDPIDKEVAEDIRAMLQRKIGVQVVEGEREADKEAAEQSAPTTPATV